MLKMRSENQKKKAKQSSSGKNFPNPEEFRDPGIPGKFFENFSFPGKLKIREKEKADYLQTNLSCFVANVRCLEKQYR